MAKLFENYFITFLILFLIAFLVIMVCVAIFLIRYSKNKKYDNFILQNSIALKSLNEINGHYKFYPYINFNQNHTYDNETFYNNISCSDYLIYQLQFIKSKVSNQISRIKANRNLYSKYKSEIKTITQFGQFSSPIGKLSLKELIKREKLLIEKQTLQAPITCFVLSVNIYLSNINGRIYKNKYEDFIDEEVLNLIKRLNRKSGSFYYDRGVWDAICRVERGKVSNKMRFSIYARDRYRCRKCGVSNRYAQLEVDHIIPIAKGGKSTYNNLQTLCHRCNVEKGDRLN